MGIYLVETTIFGKFVQITAKKSSKFTKKITHVDDMMIHNLVKYFVQTRLLLRYKNNKFLTNHGKFVIFISQKRSRVWIGYFTRLCIIISSTYVIFFVNLDDIFVVVCTGFHEDCGFPDTFPTNKSTQIETDYTRHIKTWPCVCVWISMIQSRTNKKGKQPSRRKHAGEKKQ